MRVRDVRPLLLFTLKGKWRFRGLTDLSERAPEVRLPGFRRSGGRAQQKRAAASSVNLVKRETKPPGQGGMATSVPPQLEAKRMVGTTRGDLTTCLVTHYIVPPRLNTLGCWRINTNTEDCQGISIHCRQTRQTSNIRLFLQNKCKLDQFLSFSASLFWCTENIRATRQGYFTKRFDNLNKLPAQR